VIFVFALSLLYILIPYHKTRLAFMKVLWLLLKLSLLLFIILQ